MTFCVNSNIIIVDTESEVNKMSPKTGRPKIANPRNASIHIRVTMEEKKKIMDYCKNNNITCTELLLSAIKTVVK